MTCGDHVEGARTRCGTVLLKTTAQAARAVKGSRVSSQDPSVYIVMSLLVGITDSVDRVVLRKNIACQANGMCS